MAHEIETCPICERIMKADGVRITKINGLKLEAGYSIDGWGQRRDYVDFSKEVCGECFNELEKPIKDFISKCKILKIIYRVVIKSSFSGTYQKGKIL